MRNPFEEFGSFPGLENLFANPEPQFHEAKDRARRALRDNPGAWMPTAGVKRRSGLSERATRAALDALKREGAVRSGNGGKLWRAA